MSNQILCLTWLLWGGPPRVFGDPKAPVWKVGRKLWSVWVGGEKGPVRCRTVGTLLTGRSGLPDGSRGGVTPLCLSSVRITAAWGEGANLVLSLGPAGQTWCVGCGPPPSTREHMG